MLIEHLAVLYTEGSAVTRAQEYLTGGLGIIVFNDAVNCEDRRWYIHKI